MLNNILIRKANIDEKQIIANLFQLYNYEFSEYYLNDVNENGLFPNYKYLDFYYTEKDRNLYIVFVDQKISGFFMMNRYPTFLTEGINCIAEFFVLKKYRKKDIKNSDF